MKRSSIILIPAVVFSLSTAKVLAQDAAKLKQIDPVAAALFEADVTTYKIHDGYATEWPMLREQDILWKKRAWRTVNLRNPDNAAFNTPAIDHSFAEILLSGARKGAFKVYNDDRFTDQLATDKLGPLSPKQVVSFRIKEDWIYIYGEQKLVARIIGIAPVIQTVADDGSVTEQPAFWVYYPDSRAYLAGQKLSLESNADINNLDKALDQRLFAARVDKVEPYINPER